MPSSPAVLTGVPALGEGPLRHLPRGRFVRKPEHSVALGLSGVPSSNLAPQGVLPRGSSLPRVGGGTQVPLTDLLGPHGVGSTPRL